MTSFASLLLIMPLLACTCALQQSNSKKVNLKVNFGGVPSGQFLADYQVLDMSDFPKNFARVDIQNTDQPDVFQTQLFSRRDFTFRIPVPDGLYAVTLLFAETFRPACQPGARLFDIKMGTPQSGISTVVENFDIFAAAGCASAHGERFEDVPSKDGIVVSLARRRQNPSISGFMIEGVPLPRTDRQEFKALGKATETVPLIDNQKGPASPMQYNNLGSLRGQMNPAAANV